MSNRLSGQSSLAYQGTNAVNPPNVTYSTVNPTQYNSANFSLGDLWINTVAETVWLLVSLKGTVTSGGTLATWIELGVSSSVLKLQGNTGGVVSPNGSNIINVVGDGTTITVTGNPGTNTLTASLVSGGVVNSLTGDTGGAVSPNASGTIFIAGTPGVVSVTGDPATHTLTLNTASSFATTYDADTGSATPSANVIHIAGGTNINTSATGSTVTINLDTTITGITNLATQNLTVTNSETFSNLGQGVVQSSSSGVISSSEGTDGQVLISSSTGAPAWANITAGSNITVTNGHNSITIAASGGGGGTPGMVLLQSYNLAGQTGFTFSGISGSYTSYLVVADCLALTTSFAGQITMSYQPQSGFTGYVNWQGGLNYYPYNSTVGTNQSVSSSSQYYVMPIFATGVAQYISFNMFLYNLNVSLSASATSMSAQGSVASGSNLYQVIASSNHIYAGNVTSVTMTASNGHGATFTSGTVEVYGLLN